ALSQERIREAVDVDQIKRIEIDEVSQSDVSENVSTGGSGSDVAEPVELGTAHKMWSSIRVENGRLDELSDHLAELRERVERLHAEARADVDRAEIVADADAASMLVRHIEEVAGRIRLMPIGDEFRRLHWIVRDLAATLERSVRLYTDGDEIAIDRRLPALLSEPLTHLVRNAVDHGIESVQERQASGKPIIGTIRVSASRDGSELVIRVQDDGRGITASEVADHARSAGILSADAKTPSTMDELLNLLIQPGFSTRREATRVSGRGVGLDLVSERVRHMLGGTLRLETRPGAGCTFVITVPCEASLMSVLVVRCGRRTIGIPQRNIERIADWNDADFGNDEGGAPQYDGASLVSVDNGRTDGAAVGAGGHVIVLESSGERAALAVDELLFERDVPEERITLIGQEGPYLSRAQIGGKEVDFLLLNPAAVV
ncbi:MAG TPA: ATP-binding protein, partial [Spirochaetia bacterium]|nr:ATP-binding protein [Spirochaetia bacterium]